MTTYGIDVSKHQKKIDWSKVKSSGKVQFAILRAGLGRLASQKDETFERNYANALSKGVYTAFIANMSNPSDSPINANCFVNIYVYSASTAAVELIPLADAEMSRTYTMRKISGTWRGWYMHEGAVVS